MYIQRKTTLKNVKRIFPRKKTFSLTCLFFDSNVSHFNNLQRVKILIFVNSLYTFHKFVVTSRGVGGSHGRENQGQKYNTWDSRPSTTCRGARAVPQNLIKSAQISPLRYAGVGRFGSSRMGPLCILLRKNSLTPTCSSPSRRTRTRCSTLHQRTTREFLTCGGMRKILHSFGSSLHSARAWTTKEHRLECREYEGARLYRLSAFS